MTQMLMGAGGLRRINLVISANTTGYDVAVAAGSPSDPVDVTVTVNSGVVVAGVGGTGALRTGTLPPGSRLRIVNNGSIRGAAGAGANGGAVGGAGAIGGAGWPAIWLDMPAEIDNTSGTIYGGGGGGGGGGASIGPYLATGPVAGGGGGAGRGDPGQGGGGAGTGQSGGTAPLAGSASSAGGAGSGGNGGLRSQSIGPVSDRQTEAAVGGRGGDGGDWGQPGAAGAPGTWNYSYFNGVDNFNDSGTGSAGGAGGPPGQAVRTNGNAVNWLGGYNGTQVLGPVS